MWLHQSNGINFWDFHWNAGRSPFFWWHGVKGEAPSDLQGSHKGSQPKSKTDSEKDKEEWIIDIEKTLWPSFTPGSKFTETFPLHHLINVLHCFMPVWFGSVSCIQMHPYRYISFTKDLLPVSILTVTFLKRYYPSHLTDEETEAQRSKATCLQSQSQEVWCWDLNLEMPPAPLFMWYDLPFSHLFLRNQEGGKQQPPPNSTNHCSKEDRSHNVKAWKVLRDHLS